MRTCFFSTSPVLPPLAEKNVEGERARVVCYHVTRASVILVKILPLIGSLLPFAKRVAVGASVGRRDDV